MVLVYLFCCLLLCTLRHYSSLLQYYVFLSLSFRLSAAVLTLALSTHSARICLTHYPTFVCLLLGPSYFSALMSSPDFFPSHIKKGAIFCSFWTRTGSVPHLQNSWSHKTKVKLKGRQREKERKEEQEGSEEFVDEMGSMRCRSPFPSLPPIRVIYPWSFSTVIAASLNKNTHVLMSGEEKSLYKTIRGFVTSMCFVFMFSFLCPCAVFGMSARNLF